MKFIGFRVVWAVILIWAVMGCAAASTNLGTVPRPLPATKFQLLDGGFISTYELKGKTAVVVFWACWCSKSKSLMEKVEKLAQRFKSRNDLVFIAASIDQEKDLQKLKDGILFQKLNHIRHAFSGNDVYDEAYMAFQGQNLPNVFVISPQGTIVTAGMDYDDLEKGLQQLGILQGD